MKRLDSHWNSEHNRTSWGWRWLRQSKQLKKIQVDCLIPSSKTLRSDKFDNYDDYASMIESISCKIELISSHEVLVKTRVVVQGTVISLIELYALNGFSDSFPLGCYRWAPSIRSISQVMHEWDSRMKRTAFGLQCFRIARMTFITLCTDGSLPL